MIVVISSLLLFFPIHAAYAYLDPGAGSMLIQVAMAGVAGVLTLVKIYWNNIKEFFTKIKRRPRS